MATRMRIESIDVHGGYLQPYYRINVNTSRKVVHVVKMVGTRAICSHCDSEYCTHACFVERFYREGAE